jgi:hypothetical protein
MYVFLNLIETRLSQRVPLVELELLIIKDKLSWSHHFESFTVATIIWLTVIPSSDHTGDIYLSNSYLLTSSGRLKTESLESQTIVKMLEQEYRSA